jgi:tetratricopeptide (TPR) repeat protein
MKRKKRFLAVCTLFLFGFSTFYAGCSYLRGTSIHLGHSLESETGSADIAQFFAGIRPAKGNPESHYLLGCYYQDRGMNREAIEEFKIVLAIDADHVKAINGLGVSFDLLGEYSMANGFYKLALIKNPNLDYVKNNLGYSLILQKKAEDAIPALKEAVALNKGEGLFRNNLGLAYARSGQFEMALKEFSFGGDEVKAHFNVAEIYYEKGLYKEAQIHYAEALRRDPSSTLARTAAKAADSLRRVFQPVSIPIEPTRFVKIMPGGEIRTVSEKEIPPEPVKVQPSVEASMKTAEPPAEPEQKMSAEPLSTNSSAPAETSPKPAVIIRAETFRRTIQFAENIPMNGNGGAASHEYQANTKEKIITTSLTVPPMRVSKAENQIGAIEAPAQMTSINSKSPSERVGIEVSNGNGMNRMARKVGAYLKTQGHEVRRLTNANNFNYGITKIYYQEGHSQEARQIADQISRVDEIVRVKKLDRADIQVKVLLGKDLVPQLKRFEPKG